jgi:hypothetical protein
LGRERAAAVAKAVMAFETLQTKPRERERERERESEKRKSVLSVDKRLALRAISAGLPWFATWRNVDSVV